MFTVPILLEGTVYRPIHQVWPYRKLYEQQATVLFVPVIFQLYFAIASSYLPIVANESHIQSKILLLYIAE